MTRIAHDERLALCDLFEQLGPDAPTLDDPWRTRDLAAHLLVRERHPSVLGVRIKALAGWTEHTQQSYARRPFDELVAMVRSGPPLWSPFSLPPVEGFLNTTEFFVHHEDVRRAGDAPQTSRELGAEVEEWMWRRLKLLARAWFRRSPVGVVLERLGSATADGEPDTIRAVSGSSIVTLVGQPSELMIYAHGRTRVAEVKKVGEPDIIELFNTTDLRT